MDYTIEIDGKEYCFKYNHSLFKRLEQIEKVKLNELEKTMSEQMFSFMSTVNYHALVVGGTKLSRENWDKLDDKMSDDQFAETLENFTSSMGKMFGGLMEKKKKK